MASSISIFGFAILVLTALNAVDAGNTVVSYLAGDLPSSSLFTTTLGIWLVITAIALWCGLRGGFAAFRKGKLRSTYLMIFALLYSVILQVDAVQLGWSALGANITIGGERLALGVNVLGFALLTWLYVLHRRTTSVHSPSADPAAT